VYAGDRVRGERLARELSKLRGEELNVVELGSAAAVPGFVDAHLHLGSLGMALTGIDLTRVSSLDELVTLVGKEAGRFDDWVYGRGWDQERLGRWPTRWDIDRAVASKPVVLVRVCGHAAVLNTEALRRLGLLGKRVRNLQVDERGEPTGLVFEDLVSLALSEAKKSLNHVEVVVEASKLLLSRGITLVGDVDVDEYWLKGLTTAYALGRLNLRVRVYLRYTLFRRLVEAGVYGGLGNDMLRIVGVKVYADGSLGARTARLSQPYSDDPSTRGVLLLDWRGIARIASEARDYGYDIAVHAIGDEALDHVLKGFTEANHVGRIEHASVVRNDQLRALARLRPRVVVQPRFIASDFWIRSRLGERFKLAYRFRSLAEASSTIGFSSDAPVEEPKPLENIYLAVTRKGLEETKSEALNLAEALHAHTRGAALAVRERRAGCLEPGCYGDIAVLSSDPLTAKLDDLPSLEVVATIVGGRLVHGRL
jgi:predicted amidohydrolase YtcJ